MTKTLSFSSMTVGGNNWAYSITVTDENDNVSFPFSGTFSTGGGGGGDVTV